MSAKSTLDKQAETFGLDITSPSQFRSHIAFLRWVSSTATKEQWEAGVELPHLVRSMGIGQPAAATHLIRKATVQKVRAGGRRNGATDIYTINSDYLNVILQCALAHIFYLQDELAGLMKVANA